MNQTHCDAIYQLFLGWQRSYATILTAIGFGLSCIPATTIAGDMHDAVRANDHTTINALLKSGESIEESDYVTGSALLIAVSDGNTKMAKLLIERGANLEAASEVNGARAIHLAAEFDDIAMLALLLDSGANIEAHNSFQETPLLRAATFGRANAVRLLLDRGANVDASGGAEMMTPLLGAAENSRIEIVKLLLDRGADINASDLGGRTAFWWTANIESFSEHGGTAFLDYLAGRGANVNAKDSSGISPLSRVEKRGGKFRSKILEALVRLGATN